MWGVYPQIDRNREDALIEFRKSMALIFDFLANFNKVSKLLSWTMQKFSVLCKVNINNVAIIVTCDRSKFCTHGRVNKLENKWSCGTKAPREKIPPNKILQYR